MELIAENTLVPVPLNKNGATNASSLSVAPPATLDCIAVMSVCVHMFTLDM